MEVERAARCAIMAGDDTRPPGVKHVETNDLRKAGLKVTLPRLKILEILGSATPRHMSAEDIYKHLLESHEDIGLATVYRVLTQFEAAGLSRAITSRARPRCSSSTRASITTISSVLTAAGSKSSWMPASKSASGRSRPSSVRDQGSLHDPVRPLQARELPVAREMSRAAAPDCSSGVFFAGRALARLVRRPQHLARVLARLVGDLTPPSMRAISSTRSSAPSTVSTVRVVLPSVSFVTRR